MSNLSKSPYHSSEGTTAIANYCNAILARNNGARSAFSHNQMRRELNNAGVIGFKGHEQSAGHNDSLLIASMKGKYKFTTVGGKIVWIEFANNRSNPVEVPATENPVRRTRISDESFNEARSKFQKISSKLAPVNDLETAKAEAIARGRARAIADAAKLRAIEEESYLKALRELTNNNQ